MTYTLVERGERVVVLDDLSSEIRDLVAPEAEFVLADVGDSDLMRRVRDGIDAVTHY